MTGYLTGLKPQHIIGIYKQFFLDFDDVIDWKLFSLILKEDIVRKYSEK